MRPDAIFSGELENDDSEPVTKPQPKKTLAATSTPTSSDKGAVPSNSPQSLDVVPDGKFTPQAGSPADDWLALVSLYGENDPARLGEVDRLLLKYKGKEGALWENLEKKYGKGSVKKARAAPFKNMLESIVNLKLTLTLLYQAENPTKLSDVKELLSKYKGMKV